MKGFVKRWLGAEKPVVKAPHVPEGQRIYCIGDIHGRADLLQEIHRLIEADAAGFEGERILVYLGDYIDRGEQSSKVIEVLRQVPLEGFHPIRLLGNHERAMLDFLEHPRAVASWLTFGGRATLRSYGVSMNLHDPQQDLREVRDELEDKLPRSHLDFLQDLYLAYVAGSYCFVHAGIRPGFSLREQRDEDLLWIRDDFTRSKASHEYVVVHGHSITLEAELLPNRIGIDTGAFYTGILTCLVLEGHEQRLLQTGAGGSHA